MYTSDSDFIPGLCVSTASMFTLKKQCEVEKDGDDDFQTVDEDEEASPMEIDKPVSEKRRKVSLFGSCLLVIFVWGWEDLKIWTAGLFCFLFF